MQFCDSSHSNPFIFVAILKAAAQVRLALKKRHAELTSNVALIAELTKHASDLNPEKQQRQIIIPSPTTYGGGGDRAVVSTTSTSSCVPNVDDVVHRFRVDTIDPLMLSLKVRN